MYKNNGKQVLYEGNEGLFHIADAETPETAHALTTGMNERSPNFIRDALVTCSPLFHGDMVSRHEFVETVNDAIKVLNKLDRVKKSLFYGRDNNLIADGQGDTSDLPDKFGSDLERPKAINVIHAILGIATEAGELLEALREGYNGNGFDWVNIKEEAGDVAWYEALLADAGDYTFEEVQQLIIAKLKTRFADKFSAAEANTRNLDAERQVLEGATPQPLPDDGWREDVALDEIAGEPADELGPMQDEGDVVAGNTTYDPRTSETRSPEGGGDPTAASVPGLKPSTPASGKTAVEAAEAESNQAFANVGNVPAKDEPTIQGSDELAKSPAERLNPLPGEDTAQQNASGVPGAE